jgi:glutamyl-tRNA synthetase
MVTRVRFAPSPTGYLHIGGLRTALYDYLLAKKDGGAFVLRIEDTDRERHVADATQKLLQTLMACGLQPDEGVVLSKDGDVTQVGDCGPYIQSERLSIYSKYSQQLLDNGHAYHCFCTQEDLSTMRAAQTAAHQLPRYDRRCLKLTPDDVKQKLSANVPHVIRLKVPDEGSCTFTDAIRGDVTFNYAEVDDQVLVKSDGFPTYHLAVVVDDHLMGITHALRGEEWISSTPKHLLLYEALGWQPPIFAHLPLLLSTSRAKLSKRQGDVAVEDFLAKGYLPAALLNFVALLGWNPKTEQELFTLPELVQAFSLEQVNRAGAIVDIARLDWFNNQHIRRIVSQRTEYPDEYEDLRSRAVKYMAAGLTETQQDAVLALEAERIHRLEELVDATAYLATLPEYDRNLLVFKKSDADRTKRGFVAAVAALAEVGEWTEATINTALERAQHDADLNPGDIFWPVRVALSGRQSSPPPAAIAAILGKDETMRRIKAAMA